MIHHSNALDRLKPCGAKTGNAELSSCLLLVAPTGMGEAERRNWIAVARNELAGIPEDLMKRGCAAARRVADHPSKILPAIFREIGATWEARKRTEREIAREIEAAKRSRERAALPAAEVCTPEAAAAILAEFAGKRRGDDAVPGK